jgi:hypothetical protein
METYWEVEALLHIFLASALDGNETQEQSLAPAGNRTTIPLTPRSEPVAIPTELNSKIQNFSQG